MSDRAATDHHRPLRVMLVIEYLQYGGTERQLHHLALGLRRAGVEVEVCCLRGPGPFGDSLRRHGITVYKVQKHRKVDVTLPFRLASLFRRRRVDVVHLFLFTASLWGGMAARLARVSAVIATDRNVDHLELRDHPADVLLFRLAARLFHDRILGNSGQVTRYLERALKIPSHRLATVYNGLDTEEVQPRRTPGEVRAELGVGDESPVILMVGRLARQKNYPLFLRAMAHLREANPDLVGLVAGQGPLEAELQSFSATLGLAEVVRFLGPRNDIPDLMVAADIVVLTSDWEGFPNTLLEAMWLERPVVATDVGGCQEVVVDGETGYLVQAGDEAAFVAASQRLLDDPDLRERMGAAGRRRVLDLFTAERLVTATLDQYAITLRARGVTGLGASLEIARG